MSEAGIVETQFAELSSRYPGLRLTCADNGMCRIVGTLHFSASYDGTTVEDVFEIEIALPGDYPDSPPVSREVGGRIPKEFHQYTIGAMCLGAPLDVRRRFAEMPTLVGFVETLLIPYLFSFVHWRASGAMPYGELSHGGKGLLEYYSSLFAVSDGAAVLGFLKILADHDYRGHLDCPCGGGRKLRACHGPMLRKLAAYQSKDAFVRDYGEILIALEPSDHSIPRRFKSKALDKYLRESRRAATTVKVAPQPVGAPSGVGTDVAQPSNHVEVCEGDTAVPRSKRPETV